VDLLRIRSRRGPRNYLVRRVFLPNQRCIDLKLGLEVKAKRRMGETKMRRLLQKTWHQRCSDPSISGPGPTVLRSEHWTRHAAWAFYTDLLLAFVQRCSDLSSDKVGLKFGPAFKYRKIVFYFLTAQRHDITWGFLRRASFSLFVRLAVTGFCAAL